MHPLMRSRQSHPPLNIRVIAADRARLTRMVDGLRQIANVTRVSRTRAADSGGVMAYVEATDTRTVTIVDGDLFTCPRCGRHSSHPVDVAEGYCGFCHSWTGVTTTDQSWNDMLERDPMAFLAIFGIPVDVDASGSVHWRTRGPQQMTPVTLKRLCRALYRVAEGAEDKRDRPDRTECVDEPAAADLPEAGGSR